MPSFSKKSADRLATCHPDLQKVMNEAIKHYDFSIVCGTRTIEEQFELFKQGRALVDGSWKVTNKSKIVTNIDGSAKKSKHNHTPSLAVDIIPYPSAYSDAKKFFELSKVVLESAKKVGVKIKWGADWDMDGDISDESFIDLPHWELA